MEDHTYEVEIRSLLGTAKNADRLRSHLYSREGVTVLGSHTQRNHYFHLPDGLTLLQQSLSSYIPEEKHSALTRLLEEGKDHSTRTRDADGAITFIIKASVGDDSSVNGISRMEFESPIPLSLEELDEVLFAAGLSHHSKWSREREEFAVEPEEMNVTIDRNAGYGYLAEFERVVSRRGDVEEAREAIIAFMGDLELEELPQDRLDRMFNHYTKHWQEYYQTDKTFTIL